MTYAFSSSNFLLLALLLQSDPIMKLKGKTYFIFVLSLGFHDYLGLNELLAFLKKITFQKLIIYSLLSKKKYRQHPMRGHR